MDESNRILVVDDEPDNFEVIEILLFSEGYELFYASSGQQALDSLASVQPDAILLDIMLPDISGIEVCRCIKAHDRWATVPVLAVTALSSKQSLADCFQAGAEDFIRKPVDGVELRSRLRSLLRLRHQQQNIEQLVSRLRSANERLERFNSNLEQTVRDRTRQLRQSILTDPLTGLPSRAALLQALEAALMSPRRCANAPFALLCIDCDRFRTINSSLGYAIGDRLIAVIGNRLRSFQGDGAFLGRSGEDEFYLLIEPARRGVALGAGGGTDRAEALAPPPFDTVAAEAIAADILEKLQTPFQIEGFEVFLSACVGIAWDSPHYHSALDPLRDANTAMYQAKARGKGSFQTFDPTVHDRLITRMHLERDLRRAVDQGEIRAFYQPIVNLSTGAVVGFEALARWHDRDRGNVSPAEFIPCAEETGTIVALGFQILHQACCQTRQWLDLNLPLDFVSVNLSAKQFSYPFLLADIQRTLAETGCPAAAIKLEITEGTIIEDPTSAAELVQQLRNLGLRVGIDDFGTGYSSLNYLHQLPANTLKIDRSFVEAIGRDERRAAIIAAVIAVGRSLDMALVGEGVSERAHADYLRLLGCEYGQGFFFAPALPPEEATTWLELPSSRWADRFDPTLS
ncbi:MAG: hypothetical protein Fur0042_21170 [Cyanophyceae cyanobacterium]